MMPLRALVATYNHRRLGTFGHATATSFFPAKPLGCYGDGGAVMTDDDGMADALRSLRVHGQGSDKYDNVRIGLASRLDTIQAAILIEKLKIFPDEIDARNKVARRYSERLGDVVTVPVVPAVPPPFGLNTPFGWRAAGATSWRPFSRQRAFRPLSTTRSRCIDSRRTSIIRSAKEAWP